MTTPSVVPTKYKKSDLDYLNAPCDKSGAVRNVRGSVTVPAATAQDAYIGLVPFRKGASFMLNDKSIYCADLDTSTNVTLDVGIIYDVDGTYTNDIDAFASASTSPQTGGFVTIDEISGMTFVAEADGWLACQVNAATTTEGAITFNVGVAYN